MMRFRLSRLFPLMVGGLIGCLAAAALVGGVFERWSSFVSDRFFLSRSPDASIVIIAIDDASLGRLGRWPWKRTVHAQLIQALHQAGVTAIGYDVNFPEASSPEDDVALAQAIQQAGNVVLPVEVTFTQQDGRLIFDPASRVAPIPSLASAATYLGHTNTPPDIDGVIRRIPVVAQQANGEELPAFAARVYELAKQPLSFKGLPVDHQSRLTVNFDGPPGHTFPVFSAADVIDGKISSAALKGKVAFVGATAFDLHDQQLVPTSLGQPMPGVEIHASLYDTLIAQRWLTPVPVWWIVAWLIVFGLLLGFMIPRMRSRYSAPLAVLVWLMYVVIALIAFDRGHVLDVVWPTMTLVFAYTAITLEQRVASDRERRELRDAFSHYVSPSVVESILRDPSRLKLGGDKRRMTVLFSDLRGFTTLSESLDPQALVEILNTYLTRMTDIVFEHEGVLDKYIGDAVMAFWNAPLDQSKHAEQAVRTALAMQKALREMNASDVFPNGVTLKIGVGVNTGDMVVGNMGSGTRFDYTVIGDNVNLAARLEGVTKEYGVGLLITEATRQEIGEAFVTRRVDQVAVKGKKEPVIIHEVLALSEHVTPDDRRLVHLFETALEAYMKREFTSAEKQCQTLLQMFPDDGPSKVLLERCHIYLDNPPPVDWNGTWVMTKK